MFLIAAAGITAFFLCLTATPLVRNISLRAKLLDHPDKVRKLHRRAIPRLGGVAIALSYAGTLGLILLITPHSITSMLLHGSLAHAFLPAAGVIFLTGLIDDLITLKPWQKLFGQSLASALAVSLGTHLSMVHGSAWLGMGLSFFLLLACANAFNLIDGLDGLATGVALLVALATLLPAILDGNLSLAISAIALMGCLVAFLRYNFHPASIFLGDCGSLTIGFMLGCFALSWNRHTDTTLGALAPLIALALPLLDVALSIGRRLVRNAPLFEGDRSHIHHKVLARSRTTRRTVLVLYGVCACTSILAMLLSYSQPRSQWIILLAFGTLACLGVKSLRYVELTAVFRSFSRRSILRLMKQEIYLVELEDALAKTDTLEAVWDITCLTCEDLHFASVRMHLHDRSYEMALGTTQDEMVWQMTIPLGAKGYLVLTRAKTMEHSQLIFSALGCLHDSLLRKDLVGDENQVTLPTFSYQGAA